MLQVKRNIPNKEFVPLLRYESTNQYSEMILGCSTYLDQLFIKIRAVVVAQSAERMLRISKDPG